MTDADAAIDAAMTSTNGDSVQAATLLNIPTKTMLYRIKASRVLRERWVNKYEHTAPPTVAVALHRPPLEPAASDVELASALEKQDALVRGGFEKMGFSPPAQEMAMAMQAFQRRHFMSALDLMGGGLVKQFMDIMLEVQRLNGMISQTPEGKLEAKDPDEIGAILSELSETEKIRREDRRGLLDLLVKIYDRTATARLKLVEAAAREGSGRPDERKPGFAPLTVTGRNVQVNLNGKKPANPGR